MDINVALANARRLTSLLLDAADAGLLPDGSDVVELAEQVQAIDEWMSQGGFLPTAWER